MRKRAKKSSGPYTAVRTTAASTDFGKFFEHAGQRSFPFLHLDGGVAAASSLRFKRLTLALLASKLDSPA